MGASDRIKSNFVKEVQKILTGDDFVKKISNLRKEKAGERAITKNLIKQGEGYVPIEQSMGSNLSKDKLRQRAQELKDNNDTEGLQRMIEERATHNKKLQDAQFITENTRQIRREDNFNKTVQKKSLTQQINGVDFVKNKDDGEWWSK
jgi:hypothetical protein